MKCHSLCLLLLCAAGAQANVYQCEQDGKVTFSQFPCEESAELTQEVSAGNVILSSNKKSDQQMEGLKKKGRYLEYQLSVLEQQQKKQLTALEDEYYEAQKKGAKSNYLAMLNQKMQKLRQEFAEQQQKQQQELTALHHQMSTLQRQYAVN
ncbi:DUF4124 domain-containing protein [Rheinheimera sp.]|uniref:DUF4124 domain-containing protein n=1 Tax=Rheinheimera sp. TaxID=1869214 RepID=UPI0027B89BAB|nr:DUF4124 domain-containing protein [Rheinheimera sp.]